MESLGCFIPFPKAPPSPLSPSLTSLALPQLAHQCMREVRRAAIQAQKNCKETLPRARRLTKEMMLYWKKYDKVEKEHRKRAEKEAQEQRKLDEEMREVGVPGPGVSRWVLCWSHKADKSCFAFFLSMSTNQ